MPDGSLTYNKQRRGILLAGITLFSISFFLTGVWDSKPPADPIPGWYCAGFALRTTQGLIQRGWPSNSWIFQYRQFEFFSLLVSGWINPLFVIAAILVVIQKDRRPFRILRILLLAILPFCWVVFIYERFYPREGYLLWTIGMILVLFSNELARLAQRKTTQTGVSPVLLMHRKND